ncbi:MAG: SDR family NAD(P)-dependent oxidoreductase, partial [Alphaproteobacteria bacterium]
MTRTVWIVGASTGIGRQLALDYANEGWQVAVSARSAGKLDELVVGHPGI